MSKSGSVTEDPNSSTCGACNSKVVAGEKAMQCDLCNRWVHNVCCSMPDDLYKVLVKHENKNTGIKWFCEVCELHFGKVKLEIKLVAERQVTVELKQIVLKESLTEVKREVSELKKELKEFVKEKEQNAESTSVKVEDKF